MKVSKLKGLYNSSAIVVFLKNYIPIELNFKKSQLNKDNFSTKLEYYFTKEKDLYISEFPTLIQSNQQRWLVADLYFHHLLKNNPNISFKTLKSISYHLLHYLRFIEHKNSHITDSPKDKYKKITFRFRSELIHLIEDNLISVETAQQRINTIVNFYEICYKNKYIDKEKYPLYEIEHYDYIGINGHGGRYSKKQRKTNLHISTNNNIQNINTINGYRKLKPLEIKDLLILLNTLKNYNDYQFVLMCYIALYTGARIQTVSTLRTNQILNLKVKNQKNISYFGYYEYPILVGKNTLTDTKNGNIFNLYIPDFILQKLELYINSDFYKKRSSKCKLKNTDDQYLFLTKHGNPYITHKNTSIENNDSIYDGTAIRMKISKLIKQINKIYPTFKNFTFHDLRATYAINFITDINNMGYNTNYALNILKDRMGHNDITSTLRYINFYNDRIKIENIEKKYEGFLFKKESENLK